jgi:MFS transporter, AAHS family, 4-hydroxybenzoate transporter
MAMPRFLIAVCFLVYLLDGLIHSMLGPLAPEMSKSLHLAISQLGPIFSANLAGQCAGLIALPLVASRTSQRTVVLVSVVGFGIAQACTALATGADSLFVWRLVTGFFLGGCLPSCLALVTAAAPAPRRGLAIMILFSGYGLGATLAGMVATAFVGFGGWRMAMVAVGAASLVTALIAAFGLRGASGRVESDAAEGAIKPGALQIVAPRYLLGTLMLWLLFICMLTISYCLISWLPTLLVEVGRDARFAALSISVFSLGGIIAALGVGVLIDRLGAMRTLISFLGIGTVLLYLVGQMIASASGGVLMTMLAACGFFVLGAYGGINVVLATYYPAPLRAPGIGWSKSVGRIGTLIAPVLIGIALGAGIAETSIMSLFAVPALVAMGTLIVIATCTCWSELPSDLAALEPG